MKLVGRARPHGHAHAGMLLAGGAVLVFGGLAFALARPQLAGPTGPDLSGAIWSSPSPTVAPQAVRPAGVQMPEGADCLACHLARDGQIGSDPVPAIAHPVQGWTSCTGCHSTDRLVKTAPGHSGIHAADCLTCHTKSTPAAPARPHAADQNVACTQCHGTKVALPKDHGNRTQTQCWLCHAASYAEAPTLPHPVPTDRTCRSCHSASGVGALPATHATRSDSMCTLCHRVAPTAPLAPHSLGPTSGLCSTCHGGPQALGKASSSPSPSAP